MVDLKEAQKLEQGLLNLIIVKIVTKQMMLVVFLFLIEMEIVFNMKILFKFRLRDYWIFTLNICVVHICSAIIVAVNLILLKNLQENVQVVTLEAC